MSVEQTGTIDYIICNRRTGKHCIWIISDHLNWTDDVDHRDLLRAKVNSYIAQAAVADVFHPLTIAVTFQYRPDPSGRAFLDELKSKVEAAGYRWCDDDGNPDLDPATNQYAQTIVNILRSVVRSPHK